MNKLMELRQELVKLYAEERSDLERAKAENRGLTPAEQEQSTKREARIQEAERECQAIDAVNARAAEMKEREERLLAQGVKAPESAPGAEKRKDPLAIERRAVVDYLLFGDPQSAERGMRQAQEIRGTHTATVFGDGGALVLPVELSNTILQVADNEFVLGGMVSTTTLTTAASIQMPTVESQPSDFDWTGELGTGTEGNVGFGARQLTPYPLAKQAKLSNTLMRLASNAEPKVMERLAYVAGGTWEKNMLTGTGINQPLGMLANSGPGAIPVGRDKTGAVTWDNIYDVIGHLREAYKRRAVWLTHRDHLTTLRKTKDSQGRYLVDINTANNEGVTTFLAGRPVVSSEFFPSATSSGSYSFLLGDFSNYQRVMVERTMSVQVLRELFALQNTTGYIFRLEGDGMPIFTEAFARLKFA